MNIKESIKKLLQTKFGGVVLSDARIEQFAKQAEGKVTDEAGLLAKLEAWNEGYPFATIKSDDDRMRSLEAEAKKKPEAKPEPKVEETKKEEVKDDEIPAWAKALIDGQKAMTETVSALKGEKLVTDRKTAILAKLDGASEDYKAKVVRDFGYMNFADDNAFGEFLGHVESDYAAHVQRQAESSLGKDAPFLGVGSDGRVKEASKAELDAVMNEIKF